MASIGCRGKADEDLMRGRRTRTTTRMLGTAMTFAAAAVVAGCAGGGVPEVDVDQDRPFVLTGVDGLTEIARLTGPDAINDTEPAAVAGTDLGSMTNIGDKTFFFFGDTFG
jgi:hypothetical protein